MIIVMLCSLIMLGFSPVMAAEVPTPDKITSIITKSKVLGDNTKVVSSISGNEAVVSTYRHRDSVNIDNDCKIDASFIAKELMIANDFGLRRVTVHFHEPDLIGNYREVSVSFAEIKAFASGAVEQKDFLASLSLNLLPEPGSKSSAASEQGSSTGASDNSKGAAASGSPADMSAQASATDSSKNQLASVTQGSGPSASAAPGIAVSGSTKSSSSAKAPAKVILPRQRFSSARAGFTFLLPYGWILEPLKAPSAPARGFQRRGRPSTSETIFILRNPSTGYKQIECYRKTDNSTPDISAAKIKQEFSYPGTHIDKYQSISFGKGPYGGALVVARYPHEAGEYHETHLFFGSPGMYYDLRGWGPTSDKTFEPAFYDLIATIEFPPAKSPGGKPAKK